jgi:hypothetical protein
MDKCQLIQLKVEYFVIHMVLLKCNWHCSRRGGATWGRLTPGVNRPPFRPTQHVAPPRDIPKAVVHAIP